MDTRVIWKKIYPPQFLLSRSLTIETDITIVKWRSMLVECEFINKCQVILICNNHAVCAIYI